MPSRSVFDYTHKVQTLEEYSGRAQTKEFWEDPSAANNTLRSLAEVREGVERLDRIFSRLQEAQEILFLFPQEKEVEREIEEILSQVKVEIENLETTTKFDRQYDACNALISINAGAGGTDASDWTEMLSRMYIRWAKSKGFSVQVVDESPAEEAGLKSITFFVRGRNAYGMIEGERGVHRLIRMSPFDKNQARHTSFSQVDIIPEIKKEVSEEIKSDTLEITTFKASGSGGQHINKTESAIRVKHIPTGIVVTCSQERSQQQNREVAMVMLRSKLAHREALMKEKELAEIRGERQANEWGSQIRSYTVHPQTRVKDHRTGVETPTIQEVLDGDIDRFIQAYLQQR